jgi:hypothetical protein
MRTTAIRPLCHRADISPTKLRRILADELTNKLRKLELQTQEFIREFQALNLQRTLHSRLPEVFNHTLQFMREKSADYERESKDSCRLLASLWEKEYDIISKSARIATQKSIFEGYASALESRIQQLGQQLSDGNKKVIAASAHPGNLPSEHKTIDQRIFDRCKIESEGDNLYAKDRSKLKGRIEAVFKELNSKRHSLQEVRKLRELINENRMHEIDNAATLNARRSG